ncbi:hypothetical protein RSOLAG22IIIB_00552 [Rhizoctonia solani]|uniref:Uncharacterized protein n=1 Tax=Rhizoctonia solani TaxID=456999 RepID=A0A0K6FW17_9AGAM|nr:hypothetical protein RSOLAG22IIIB_00552 [Rhizoctonia solani]
MSHNIQYARFPIDPDLGYPPPPQPGLPPPPGAPFVTQHPPIPMGPPAVLGENVAEILKPLQEELGRMAAAIASISETTHGLTKSIHELGERFKVVEAAAKKPDSGAGSDGDDEGPGGTRGEVQRRPSKLPVVALVHPNTTWPATLIPLFLPTSFHLCFLITN